MPQHGQAFSQYKKAPLEGEPLPAAAGRSEQAALCILLRRGFRLGEQGVQVAFAVDGDAVGFEEGGGHAVAGGEAAGERAVVDLAAAAARAALFQDGRFAAVEPGQMQRLLRPTAKLRGHVRAGS